MPVIWLDLWNVPPLPEFFASDRYDREPLIFLREFVPTIATGPARWPRAHRIRSDTNTHRILPTSLYSWREQGPDRRDTLPERPTASRSKHRRVCRPQQPRTRPLRHPTSAGSFVGTRLFQATADQALTPRAPPAVPLRYVENVRRLDDARTPCCFSRSKSLSSLTTNSEPASAAHSRMRLSGSSAVMASVCIGVTIRPTFSSRCRAASRS